MTLQYLQTLHFFFSVSHYTDKIYLKVSKHTRVKGRDENWPRTSVSADPHAREDPM